MKAVSISPDSIDSLEVQFEKKAELTEKERVRRISAVIRYAESKLRRQFPLLQKQNLLGLLIFAVSCLGFTFNAVLYLKDFIPAWMCIIGNAVYASFLHELEHDLIHNLYFKTRPAIQNSLMWGIWFLRGNLISPWYRRMIHLIHHKESGQKNDIEERLIGNGMKWGFKRLIITLDPLMTQLRFPEFIKEIPSFNIWSIWRATFPIFIIFNAIWISFIICKSWEIFNLSSYGWQMPFSPAYTAIVSALFVVLVAPNILRQACLTFISSSCHYYGDIPKADLIRQMQVLHPWYLIPFQLFCFNFGSTHIIHHFVVNQPFYIRQLVAPLAHAAMQKYGIRFNDIQTLMRANRFSSTSSIS
jgi:fatty acid desaturase